MHIIPLQKLLARIISPFFGTKTGVSGPHPAIGAWPLHMMYTIMPAAALASKCAACPTTSHVPPPAHYSCSSQHNSFPIQQAIPRPALLQPCTPTLLRQNHTPYPTISPASSLLASKPCKYRRCPAQNPLFSPKPLPFPASTLIPAFSTPQHGRPPPLLPSCSHVRLPPAATPPPDLSSRRLPACHFFFSPLASSISGIMPSTTPCPAPSLCLFVCRRRGPCENGRDWFEQGLARRSPRMASSPRAPFAPNTLPLHFVRFFLIRPRPSSKNTHAKRKVFD